MSIRRTTLKIYDVFANRQGVSNALESAARRYMRLTPTERTTDMKQKPKADKEAALGYSLASSLAGCANIGQAGEMHGLRLRPSPGRPGPD